MHSNLNSNLTDTNIEKNLKFQLSTLFLPQNDSPKINKKTDYIKSCSFCESKFSSESAYTQHNKIKHNEFNKVGPKCKKIKKVNNMIKTSILTNEELPIFENEETTNYKVPKWSRNLEECLFFIEKSYRCKSIENKIVQSSNLYSFSPILIRPIEEPLDENFSSKIFV